MSGRRGRPRQPPNVTLKNQCISFQTVYYSLPSLSVSLYRSLSVALPCCFSFSFSLPSPFRSPTGPNRPVTTKVKRQLKTSVTRCFLQWNAKKREPKKVNCTLCRLESLPEPCLSPAEALSTACVQPFYSLSAAWVQPSYSLSAAFLQPVCSFSTAFLALGHSLSATFLQPGCSLSAL